MTDNERIAAEVLDAVGGKDNITSIAHCMTRLRINLKDESVPDDDRIKAIKGVVGWVASIRSSSARTFQRSTTQS
jgi:beta-glucoside PTS system EIICBA component